MKKIAVFGDSILKGAVTGLTDHLFDILPENSLTIAQKKLGFELFNDSVFGSIITKTQRRLNKFFEKGEKADFVILESGGNDSDYDWNVLAASDSEIPLQPRTPLSDYLRVWEEMVQTVKSNGAVPIVMTTPSLVADRWYRHVTRALDEKGKSKVDAFLGECPVDTISKLHETYNLNLMEFCRSNNVFFVDMRKALLDTEHYRDLMCQDGIHPNQMGYEFMATVWEKELPLIMNQ